MGLVLPASPPFPSPQVAAGRDRKAAPRRRRPGLLPAPGTRGSGLGPARSTCVVAMATAAPPGPSAAGPLRAARASACGTRRWLAGPCRCGAAPGGDSGETEASGQRLAAGLVGAAERGAGKPRGVRCAGCLSGCHCHTGASERGVPQAVLIPDVIDVEAPEYLATDLLVLLYMEPDPRCSHCFRAALPVHGRYHRPAEESEDALVILKSPEVLICCCDNCLSVECWKPAEVEAPCSGKNVGPCRWYSVMHKPAYEESILQVPVGLRQHSSLVCVVTLLATVLCSGLILAAVCKYGHFSPVTCSE
ncbi:phosphatidylinositol-glycan biosynthesis class X protein isoform 1-T1 [Theristicus caerulescens]